MFTFTTLDDLKETALSILIYGPAKTGKTQLAASISNTPLIIDNGQGLETIRSPYFRKQFPEFKPLIYTIPNEDLEDKPKNFDLICDMIDEALEKHSDKFDAIILDDSTQFDKASVFKGMETNQNLEKSKGSLDKVKKAKILTPNVQDFGTAKEYNAKFMAGTIDLCKRNNKHFVVLAHERLNFKKGSQIGDQPELIKVSPYFTGVDKSPDYITGLFDWVLYTEVIGGGDQKIYRVRVQGTNALTASIRGAPPKMFGETETKCSLKEMINRYRTGEAKK